MATSLLGKQQLPNPFLLPPAQPASPRASRWFCSAQYPCPVFATGLRVGVWENSTTPCFLFDGVWENSSTLCLQFDGVWNILLLSVVF